MSTNTQIVEAYLDGFRRTDRELILSCLTDDVEWLIPGAFHIHGIDAFAGHIVDEGFTGNPEILVSRMTEAGAGVGSRVCVGPTPPPPTPWSVSDPSRARV